MERHAGPRPRARGRARTQSAGPGATARRYITYMGYITSIRLRLRAVLDRVERIALIVLPFEALAQFGDGTADKGLLAA